ncbi:MAG: S1 RNA-binding domain-containing protein, partial [Butyrivibrio sp.]|nr:S1 RNA-binding domain-containing protein [Butyrivibrio sp.]
AYEQCAGFLRIADGENPLDATSVHPESYDATLKLMDKLGITFDDVRAAQKNAAKAVLEKPVARTENKPAPKKKPKQVVIKNTNTAMGAALAAALAGSDLAVVEDDVKDKNAGAKGGSDTGAQGAFSGSLSYKISESDKKKLAEELGVGEITLTDILSELEKPSRDPRENMPAPILRSDVLDMKDLKPGMVLKGTVRNVIDFGCFVDIGVHQDGLVHISHITDRFIKHPLEAVSVGDIVDVQVLDVEVDKKRISLSMKIRDAAQVAAEAEAQRAARGAQNAAKAAQAKAKDEEAKVTKKAAKAASPVKRTVTKKATVAKAEGAKKATVTKTEGAKTATSSATASSSADGAAPVKKFKKKGIVIFKGNAND